MTRITRRAVLAAVPALAAAGAAGPALATEAERAEIDALADAALESLFADNPAARELAGKAKGLLVFPEITKAGFVVGGQAGRGALRVEDMSVGYYRIVSASIGFQAGAQTYSQVLMFMSEDALADFRASKGWEAGVDGSVAVMEQGVSVGTDTTAAEAPIVAFVFGEKGLMASASVEGSKYSELDI